MPPRVKILILQQPMPLLDPLILGIPKIKTTVIAIKWKRFFLLIFDYSLKACYETGIVEQYIKVFNLVSQLMGHNFAKTKQQQFESSSAHQAINVDAFIKGPIFTILCGYLICILFILLEFVREFILKAGFFHFLIETLVRSRSIWKPLSLVIHAVQRFLINYFIMWTETRIIICLWDNTVNKLIFQNKVKLCYRFYLCREIWFILIKVQRWPRGYFLWGMFPRSDHKKNNFPELITLNDLVSINPIKQSTIICPGYFKFTIQNY